MKSRISSLTSEVSRRAVRRSEFKMFVLVQGIGCITLLCLELRISFDVDQIPTSRNTPIPVRPLKKTRIRPDKNRIRPAKKPDLTKKPNTAEVLHSGSGCHPYYTCLSGLRNSARFTESNFFGKKIESVSVHQKKTGSDIM